MNRSEKPWLVYYCYGRQARIVQGHATEDEARKACATLNAALPPVMSSPFDFYFVSHWKSAQGKFTRGIDRWIDDHHNNT